MELRARSGSDSDNFTFYNVSATLEYIRETAINGEAVNNELTVDRYPKVEQDKLTVLSKAAYLESDILNSRDRLRILQCTRTQRVRVCYIRKDILC